MRTDFKQLKISASKLRATRKAKLKYMQYQGIDKLSDGDFVAECSKLISSWIDKQKRENK